MYPDDPELPFLVSRRQAREAGLSDRQISRRLTAGRFVRERHGWMRSTRQGESAAAATSGLVALLAAARSVDRELVVSQLSAARLWGWPQPLGGWPPPTFTSRRGTTRYRAGRRVLVAPLPEDDVLRIGTLPVTSPARTVADCIRVQRPREGLALADAAARSRQVTASSLAVVLDRQKGWPGIRQARAVSRLVDGRRESPFESWSAWTFHELEVPAPRWQVTVTDPTGCFLGRVDAWWQPGVAGEADGRVKYRLRAAERGGADGETLARILDEEREREQAIRATGADVQRWGPSDVLNPRKAEALASRLRGAVDLASRHPRFTGQIR